MHHFRIKQKVFLDFFSKSWHMFYYIVFFFLVLIFLKLLDEQIRWTWVNEIKEIPGAFYSLLCHFRHLCSQIWWRRSNMQIYANAYSPSPFPPLPRCFFWVRPSSTYVKGRTGDDVDAVDCKHFRKVMQTLQMPNTWLTGEEGESEWLPDSFLFRFCQPRSG